MTWAECSDVNVFPRGDRSLPPAFTVLPNAIEKSARSVIVHGLADFILIAEGTRIVIQNMTCACSLPPMCVCVYVWDVGVLIQM